MVTLAQALRWESSTQVEETQGEFVANPYLREQNPDFIIPAIFSYAALPRNGKIGDKVNFTFSGYHFVLEVRGIIADFPTVSGAYLVVDSNALEDHIQIADPRFDPNREIWLLLSDEGYANIESLQDLQPALLSDSRQELIQIQTDALTRGATRAFALNALILAVLSISGFLLVNYFAARSRSYEFSILRAEGLSGGQVARLLASEGALLIFLGLSAGSALGYLLVLIMRPYLSRALAGALPGMAVRQVSLNWPAISGLYALLLTFYALALLMLLLALLRLGIHRLLRIGDE
jgi:ABC-type antimicrobial peptide transport system permease subunit